MDDATVEAELRMLIGTGLRRLNRVGSAEELIAASDLAAAAGAHELLVRSVTELCLHGPTTQAGSVDAVGRRHLERALAAPVDSRRRARLLAAAATLTVVSDASSRGRALYHEALREAESSGDALVMRSVWMNAHLGLCHPDDLDLMRKACAGLLGAGDDEAQWEGEFLRVGLALIDADRNAFDDAVRGLDALTNVVKQRDHQRSMLQVHTVHAFIRGDLERADSLAGEAFQACLASYPVSWATSIYATLLVPIREAQGRVGELQPEVVALTASAPDFVTWHAVAAAVAYARHDRRALVAAMARLAGNGFSLAEDMTWTAIATMITRPIRGSRRHRRGGPDVRAVAPLLRPDVVERAEHPRSDRRRPGLPRRRAGRLGRRRRARPSGPGARRPARRAPPVVAGAGRHRRARRHLGDG